MTVAGRAARPRRRTGLLRWLLLGLAIGGGLVAVKRWAFDLHDIQEASMWPTLHGGEDQVLVAKACSPERRFELWVYETEDASGRRELRIKRLLGLSAEHVALRAGDLFAGPDRAKLARVERPAEILDGMLVPLFPGRDAPPPPQWRLRSGAMDVEAGGGLLLDATGAPLSAGLVPREGGDSECVMDDFRDGDGRLRHGDHPVADLRIDLSVRSLDAGSTLSLWHELHGDDERRLLLRTGELVVLRGPDAAAGELARVAWSPHDGDGVRMETIDGIFRVALLADGEELRELHRGERDTYRCGTYSAVRLGLDRGRARVARLDVRRDVHYVWPPDDEVVLQRGYWVPPESVFLVGDNAPLSEDSRAVGPIPIAALRGKAIAVVWPPRRWRRLP